MKYPFTKQEGLKDCAAASVQMIIRYYKGYISITDLNKDLELEKDGVSAYKIIKTLEKHGFNAEGVKSNIEDFSKMTPFIAHVTIDKKYDHYVVVYKIDVKRKKLVIADPINKIKKINFEEFNLIFNNVGIVMYPLKPIEFKNYKKHYSMLKILKYEKKLIKELVQISLIYMLLSITGSFFMKYLIDNINYSKKILTAIFAFFILIKIHQNLTNFMRVKILISLNKKVDLRLKTETMEKILDLPYSYYRNKTTGEILTRFEELNKVRESLTKILLTIFLDIPLSILSFIIMSCISQKLTLLASIIILFYLVIIKLFKHTLDHNIEQEQIKKTTLNKHLTETISGIETINSLRIKKLSLKKYENLYVKHINQLIKIDEIINFQHTLKEIINQLGEMIIIFTGIILVKDQQITIGALLSFTAIMNFFLSPIKNLLSLDFDFIESTKILKRINEMLHSNERTEIVKQPKGNIEINNLDFTYNDKLILNNINLNIKEGQKILLTGKSGSGKSTLLKILMKYYSIDRNKVKIGDQDLCDIIPENIMIQQQETLFTDSIENNIKLDDSKNFMNITKLCHVDEIINTKSGYKTIIEENGFNISGGQKQRIVLARALNRTKNILLIDEGLNQVDTSLERKILKNIFSYYKDKTIIIVSHRLVNMDLYDRFIKLEKGSIKEDVIKNGHI